MSEGQANGKRSRKIRNFLLDKRFQLKYTLAVVVISTVIALVLGAFLYETQQEVFEANRENSQLLVLDDPEMNQAMQAELAKADAAIAQRNQKLLLTLVLSLGGLVLLLTLLGIVATHKIAGPAYAMRRVMSQIADGRHPYLRKLRRGDELAAVAMELHRMANNLRQREEQELTTLREAGEKLAEVEGVPAETLERLRAMAAEKEQRLGTED